MTPESKTSAGDARRGGAVGAEGATGLDPEANSASTSIRVSENCCSISVFPCTPSTAGSRQASNRVAVNFIPSRLTLDLAGAPVTVSYTNHGPDGALRLVLHRGE